MYKKLLAVLLSFTMLLSMAPVMTVGANTTPSRYIVDANFEDLTSTSGVALFDEVGFTHTGYSNDAAIENAEYSFEKITEGTNSYVEFGKIKDGNASVYLQPSFTNLGEEENTIIQYKVRYSFDISAGGVSWFHPLSVSYTGAANKNLFALFNSGNYGIRYMNETNGSWVTAYKESDYNGKWLTFTYAAVKDSDTTYHIEHYMDGKKLYETAPADAALTLQQFNFAYRSDSPNHLKYALDDIKVMRKLSTFTATADFGTVQNKFPTTGGSFKLTFDAPVDLDSIASDLIIGDGSVTYTADVSEDMMTATITPTSTLAISTTYPVDFSAVKDVFGVNATGTATSFKTAEAPRFVYDIDYDTTDATGIYSFDAAGNTGEVVTGADGNKYFEMTESNRSSGTTLYQSYKTADTTSSAYQIKFRFDENSAGKVLDATWPNTLYLYYPGSHSPVTLIQKNDLRLYSLATSGWLNAAGDTDDNKWYTLTYVAFEDENGKIDFKGILADSNRVAAKFTHDANVEPEAGKFTRALIHMQNNFSEGAKYSVDDLRLINKLSTFEATADFDGLQNTFPTSGGSFKLNFDAPVDPDTLANLKIANGAVTYTTIIDDDLMSVTVTPTTTMDPLTTYAVDFSAVKDVFGVAATGNAVSFKTANASRFVYEERFNDYDPATKIMPGPFSNWTSGVVSVDNSGEYKVEAITGASGESDDKAPMFTALVDGTWSNGATTGLQLYDYNKIGAGTDAETPHVLQMKFKASPSDNTFALSDYVHINPSYNGNYYSNTVIRANNGPQLAVNTGSGGWAPVNMGDEWHTLTWALSNNTNGEKTIRVYLDGIKRKEEAITHANGFKLGYFWLPLYRMGLNSQIAFDDILVYADRDAELLSEPVQTIGASSASVNYELSAPIDLSTFEDAAFVPKNGGEPVPATAKSTSKDLSAFTVWSTEALTPDTEYTLTLTGVTDLMGNSVPAEANVEIKTNELVNGKAEGTAKVFLVGDSTMAHVPDASKTAIGWGEGLRKFLNDDMTLVNTAKGGTHSKEFYESTDGLWGWTAIMNQISEGDYVLMQLGQNDMNKVKQGTTTPYYDVTLPETVEYNDAGQFSFKYYMQKMIDEAKAKGAAPIMVSLTPLARSYNAEYKSSKTDEFNNAMYDLAVKNNLEYIDLTALSIEKFETYSNEEVETFFCDTIHFDLKGAAEIAAIFAEGLENSYSNLKNYIKDISDPFLFDAAGVIVTNDKDSRQLYNQSYWAKYTELSAAGTYTARIYSRNVDKTATLWAAGYNGGTKMTGAGLVKDVSLNSAEFASADVSFTVSAGTDSVGVYIWDGIASLSPLYEKISLR